MKTPKPQDTPYRLGTISIAVAFVLIAVQFFIPFSFPDIIEILAVLLLLALLGFGYGAILIRKDLPAFFVVFGGFGVVLFGGMFLFLLFELILFLT
jgi:hypothetical protein